MQVFEFVKGKKFIDGAVIAIGFFDGVHIAHRSLIERAAKEARERSLPLGVFTFSPESSIKPGAKRIYGTEQKLEILTELSVDFAVVADFISVVDMTKEDFVKEVLVDSCGARVIVAGYDFRFGKGASGNSDALVTLASECGVEAVIVSRYEHRGEAASSTLVRELLETARTEEAAELLGAPYFVDGVVEHGLGIGSKSLGFATVNLPIRPYQISLAKGVYRVAVRTNSGVYSGVANVGTCPTFGERTVHTEVHIIDFNGDLYGKEIRVYFLGYLRPEMKFTSEKELKMQIDVDKKRAIEENRGAKWIISGQSFR